MTQTKNATDRVAALFAAHYRHWLDIPTLALVGGLGGWRTRVSECRHIYGMLIENRVTRDSFGNVLSSEYRAVHLGRFGAGEQGRAA
jgi:hypothetical protein